MYEGTNKPNTEQIWANKVSEISFVLTIQFDFLVMRFHQNNDIATQVNHDPYLITFVGDIYAHFLCIPVREKKNAIHYVFG